MVLSNTRLRFLKPVHKPYRLTDGGGLSLEVRPSGALLWRFRYRLAGRENVFAIGSYPQMSLKEARQARDEARGLVERGIHPAHQRRAERARARCGPASLEAVARAWLQANRRRWTPRTHHQRERLLERDVFPRIGAVAMADLQPAQVRAVLKRIESRAPQMAVIARSCMAGTSQLAFQTGRVTLDLAHALRYSVPGRPPSQRRAPLPVQEIPAFFTALRRYRGNLVTQAAIRLLWLTLARSRELLEARWPELDLRRSQWLIPAPRVTPAGRHRILPLSRQTVAVLGRLKGITGSAEHLLPNRNDPSRPAGHSLFAKAFKAMGYGGILTPYGVRLTGRALLAEQARPRALDEDAPFRERRVFMQQWADHLEGVCGGIILGE